VSGGIDDRIEIYKNANSGVSADGNYVPDAPFVLLNHNQPADVPVQEFPTGGLFSTTPINTNPFAEGMFMPFSALAAGLAISPDGTTLYVANYQNDSLSIIDTARRLVSNEIRFFVPGQSTAIGEMPYWPVVLSNATGGTVKTYVSGRSDRTVQDNPRRWRTEPDDSVRRSASTLCFQRRS
jgi:YVTN family beta-propeller protein